MKKLLFVIPICLLFFSNISCANSAAEIRNEKTVLLREEVLPNGLKVFILKDRSAPLAVFQIWYHAGSANEQIGKTGLSHLLEHMMFKGTRRYGPAEFSKIIKRAGGIDNAGTTRDYTFYYQKLSPDRIHLSIELEADRMRNLVMDPEETLSERDVVMEERRLRYEDDPQNLVYEEVVSAAFKNSPYRWPVIGWMQDIKGITRDDLWKYYKERYVPNNAVIIVAGNIDVDSVLAMIRKEFGPIPKGPDIRELKIGEPEQRGERRVFVKKEAELPYVLSAYKAPNVLQKDSYALDVLAGVLSGGKSARIYRSLIDEKQIALSAGAGYSNFLKYPFLFYLYGTAMPGRSIDEVEKALYEEVEKIKEHAPTEREVQKAKNQIETDFIMGQDSIFFQAEMIGMFEMIGDWRLKDKYLEGVREVTPGDVRDAARKYLIEDKRTVGILIPLKKSE
ncbi:protease 3 precursor [bacterium BMS3Abin10]|nr:protease 3 precursor [bacterium BMS3Abin10]GBE37726.1 protease 3 precursor [bacterium BMS3Bbin08]